MLRRFEAGTPAIAEAIGLGAAVDYLSAAGMDAVHEYEDELAHLLYAELATVPGIRIFGPPPSVPLVSPGCVALAEEASAGGSSGH